MHQINQNAQKKAVSFTINIIKTHQNCVLVVVLETPNKIVEMTWWFIIQSQTSNLHALSVSARLDVYSPKTCD